MKKYNYGNNYTNIYLKQYLKSSIALKFTCMKEKCKSDMACKLTFLEKKIHHCKVIKISTCLTGGVILFETHLEKNGLTTGEQVNA